MKDGYTAYPIRATAHLMPFDTWEEGSWLLTSVEVGNEHRGKGVARGLMAQVLADADAEGVTLYLAVEPDGTGLGVSELMDWYKRCGFTSDSGLDSELAMVRRPRKAT